SSPQIRIEAEDHLCITGWEQSQIQIKIQDESRLQIREENGGFWIHCEEDCVVQLPTDAKVNVDYVNGSASISNLRGGIECDNIGGHLTLRQVGAVRCGNVGGHLKIFKIEGDLMVSNVGGNLKGGEVGGKLRVSNVGGSIKLLDVQAVDTLRAGGNIKVKLQQLGYDLNAAAGGSVKILLPTGSNYRLEASSGGERVVVRYQGQMEKVVSHRVQKTFGEGGPNLKLAAGGAVAVLEGAWEEEDVEEEFGVRVENLGDEISNRIQERLRRVEERAQQAARRAEERVQLARQRAEQTSRSNRDVFAGMQFGRFSRAGSESGSPQPAPRSRVSDEERMIVLNLLREKKITADEASRLLDALEGKKFSS
ncbi:MAG: hypothetical protein AB1453_13885, partial [Chloroflexota bacterium]